MSPNRPVAVMHDVMVNGTGYRPFTRIYVMPESRSHSGTAVSDRAISITPPAGPGPGDAKRISTTIAVTGP